ncbi:DNA helicase [Bertholletia excelsa]
MEMTEEQRQRAEANRLAALAKRKALAEAAANPDAWKLFKCRKVSYEGGTSTTVHPLIKCPSATEPFSKPQHTPLQAKFRARLEICSPDSFSVTLAAVQGFPYPGEAACLEKLSDCLANVIMSHYTQNHVGGNAPVYKLKDYDAVLRCLKNYKGVGVEIEEIPWGTFNVVDRLSHTITEKHWIPCRPEHLSDEKVNELIRNLPKKMLESLLPFQLEGVTFGLRRGGRCLIADEMGLGKTLQAIAIACCFMDKGPILVVCPAILRFSWAEELERWLPFCLPADIHLVFGHRSNPMHLTRSPRIVVISFTMLHRLQKSMLEREWALLIVDESHHVRCTKKASEPGEIKAVLDVATKVNHIVLLSGTPSLSRPFDIFHQINMLWPGLLGKNKYEFARTYCAVKTLQHSQGKLFQDFSKGTRLEELNILLKQTVMIRRLKRQVLAQLPPKRRQVINLQLKRSDIMAAVTICAKSVPSRSDEANNAHIENTDSGKSQNPRTLSKQEIGVAKVRGFVEWLAVHPISAEQDCYENAECSLSSHKMIIFAHHHKVLDRVQEFVCEKGIEFVRIDGKTSAVDRQLAVRAFQSLEKVKIAIIGLTVASFGIDLSSAQSVVFLELPQDPAHMGQAEDRAHRRGQTNPVNIYIFCAKDTLDESHWQYLNKSFQRVSSATDGKYGAMKEIEVENVSSLQTITKMDVTPANPILEEARCSIVSHLETTVLPHFDSKPDSGSAERENELAEMDDNITKEHNESESSCEEDNNIHAEADMVSDLELWKSSFIGGVLEAKIEAITACAETISPQNLEKRENESQLEKVSQYTGRIHLYSCIPGIDSRPNPLSENFRPEDLDSSSILVNSDENKSIKDNPAYRQTLLAFINEWNNLKPIQQKKLLGKPLQLPLSIELCYLTESLNHDSRGLLKGRSKRRTTPFHEIMHPLPSNAVWKKVCLCGGFGKKQKEYSQAWTVTGKPLCKLCQTPYESQNTRTPEYFEDLFCKLSCYEEYRLRTSARFLRQELFQRERGICTVCQLDCHELVKRIKPLSLATRKNYIEKKAPNLVKHKNL